MNELDPARSDPELAREFMRQAGKGTICELIGMEPISGEPGLIRARLEVRPDLLGPTGIVHAGTIVTLADSCAGMGCVASFPPHARGFTTIELKTNFLRTAKTGAGLLCEARLLHGGKRTQVWDATVSREEDGAVLAVYRCTQMLLTDEQRG